MTTLTQPRLATRYRSGDRLPNGALVHQSEVGADGQEYVVCSWHDRWVTWMIAASGGSVSGNYFDGRLAAFTDWRKRLSGRG